MGRKKNPQMVGAPEVPIPLAGSMCQVGRLHLASHGLQGIH
jgi:hypothetical protein